MKRWIKLSSALMMAALVTACGPRLTEGDVVAMLDEVNAASERHDADGAVAHFAPDATIMVMKEDASDGYNQVTVTQYKAMMQLLWSAQVSTESRIVERKVSIAEDGKHATAHAIVIDSLSVAGQRLEETSRQKAEIFLIDGKPKIVALTAERVAAAAVQARAQ